MREILFRGKRTDNGKWVKGFYVCDPQEDYEHKIYVKNTHPCGYCLTPYSVIPETIGQYTGLTDKNGKKIFEGDIIFKPSWWWGCRYVYLKRGNCGACKADNVMQYVLSKNIENPLDNPTYNLWNGNEVEVIGNIYDNPELLGGDIE